MFTGHGKGERKNIFPFKNVPQYVPEILSNASHVVKSPIRFLLGSWGRVSLINQSAGNPTGFFDESRTVISFTISLRSDAAVQKWCYVPSLHSKEWPFTWFYNKTTMTQVHKRYRSTEVHQNLIGASAKKWADSLIQVWYKYTLSHHYERYIINSLCMTMTRHILIIVNPSWEAKTIK